MGWYNRGNSALVLHNYNKLTILSRFLVPFLLVLDLILEIRYAPSPQLGRGLAFLSTFYRLGSDPSLTHSYDKCSRHGLPTYRSYKTATGESVYTFATNNNHTSCVFLMADKSHTITRASHSALPVPLVSMALAPLLPSSSQALGSDPCHGPGLYILCTILPRMPLATVLYPDSNFAFPSIDSIDTCGFVELPTQGLISGSHATSSPSPMIWPR